MEREFYKKLKPGDAVIVSSRYNESIQHVKRLTPTLIVLNSGLRFKRSHGREYGNSSHWSWNTLREATDAAINDIGVRKRRNNLISKLTNTAWGKLDTHVLERVAKCIF